MTIEKNQAIQIARQRAEEKGWAFAEPLNVTTRHGWFGGTIRLEIETSAGGLGAKARFVIDAMTGKILLEGFVPR